MNTIYIVVLCAAMLFIGYNMGYFRASRDFEKIIKIYKGIVEEYRDTLLKGSYGQMQEEWRKLAEIAREKWTI